MMTRKRGGPRRWAAMLCVCALLLPICLACAEEGRFIDDAAIFAGQSALPEGSFVDDAEVTPLPQPAPIASHDPVKDPPSDGDIPDSTTTPFVDDAEINLGGFAFAPAFQVLQREMPAGMPGEALDLELFLEFMIDGEVLRTNREVDSPDALLSYDQSVAGRVDYALLSIDGGLHNVSLIEYGVNHGYATLEGMPIPANALPGVHFATVYVQWRENVADAEPVRLLVSVPYEVLPASYAIAVASMPWGDGVIVYSYDELVAAVAQGVYSTIYLGYSDENQGVIAAPRLRGTPIGRTLTIDGTDPLTGYRMRLVDWNSSGPTDGLYASASGITVTLRNIDITGHNYYGVVYGSGQRNVSLRFEGVTYRGRQPAHNVNVGSRVTFADCTIEVANIGSGSEQELVEAANVVFEGRNAVTRTGPADYSVIWLHGDTSLSLTIAEGAHVSVETTNYLIFTDSSAGMRVDVRGSLSLSTAGPNGCFTYGDQYVGQLTVYAGGALTIRHGNAARPTLQASGLRVSGRLEINRTASASPTIRLQSGGSLVFSDPSLIWLDNAGGGGVLRSLGTASMTWTMPTVNRYVNGILQNVWNNRDMSPFSATLSINGTIASVAGVSSLEANRGAAIGATAFGGTMTLGTDTRLVLGSTALSLDAVYTGGRQVSGQAAGGAAVSVAEYAYAGGSLGARLQGVDGLPGGSFGAMLDAPIQLVGSRVYAISNDGALVCHTYQDPIAAGPMFVSVPGALTFETVSLGSTDRLVPRADAGWTLRVFDGRARGDGFSLYARVDAPMATGAGEALPGGLVFVADGAVHPLLAGDVLVYRGGEGEHAVHWAEDEGPLVYLPAFEGIAGDAYETTIIWTLVAGP